MCKKLDLTLYLGGTRSGKSQRAEAQAQRWKGPVLYVATAAAQADDAVMLERIRRHQLRRPAAWHTLECPQHLAAKVEQLMECPPHEDLQADNLLVLIDCATLWVANILLQLPEPEDLAAAEQAVCDELNALFSLMERTRCRWIVVSGEVGLGGIAAERLSRVYDDVLGLANQLLAARARAACFVVAGRVLPLLE